MQQLSFRSVISGDMVEAAALWQGGVAEIACSVLAKLDFVMSWAKATDPVKLDSVKQIKIR